MARKKSAAKKAREEAEKSATSVKSVTEPKVTSKKVQIKEPVEDIENDGSSSSSEDEDEYGEMLTENLEALIQNVIKTIKNDPKKLLDPNVKFFDEDDDVSVPSGQTKDKPMYLKDYHRMNLLSGSFKQDDDTDENKFDTVDGEKPYAVAEREERNQLLDDIKNAFNDDENEEGDDSDDGFLKKKENTASRLEEIGAPLPDPSKDPKEFLSAFLDNQAWIPKKNDKVINLDQMDNEDEQSFDDAVEDFEKAYNFRYEDPNSAEIVSYARNQATLRRGKTNSRKRARDKKTALKEQETHEIEQAVQKKKTSKLNKVIDRLSKIKEAVGEDVNDEVIQRVFGDSLLNDDFDDADWDSKMADIFNDQYYNSEITKPEWDEDDDIMAEYHESKKNDDDDGADVENNDDAEERVQDIEIGDEEPPKKRSKKDKLKEKKQSKKEKQSIREKAEKIVEANKMKIVDEVEEERGRSKEQDQNRFKYREVSPEAFGLSTREILLADDLELNQFISIKKFAPYRPKELALKDKRKLTKKKQLQQWRREVFKNKDGPQRQADEGENDIWIPVEQEQPSKKLKKSKRR